MRLSLLPMLALMAATPAAAQQVIANVGFEGPEAARYDDARDEYLVSNLGGADEGFISRVAPDGTVRELKWITGGVNGVTLDDPLGIYVKGDLVYVADGTTLRRFDRKTGAPRGSTAVPGAVRLNDLVVADDGTVYLTDSGSDDAPGAIYRISPEGQVTELVERGPEVERPNGIALTADGDLIHGGRGVNVTIRRTDGTMLREHTLPTGRFDGIVLLPGGDLLVASQDGHNVYRLPQDGGKPVPVVSDIPVPAAIGFDPKRNRVLIPQIRAATLTIAELPR